VVKYAAGSPKVSVTLQIDGTNWKYLKIEDHGPGFDLEDGPSMGGHGKSGLLGMQRRLRGIGGSLDVVSARGFGTTILAWRQPMAPIGSQYHARPQRHAPHPIV
jgi:signal transduction histidine kinase